MKKIVSIILLIVIALGANFYYQRELKLRHRDTSDSEIRTLNLNNLTFSEKIKPDVSKLLSEYEVDHSFDGLELKLAEDNFDKGIIVLRSAGLIGAPRIEIIPEKSGERNSEKRKITLARKIEKFNDNSPVKVGQATCHLSGGTFSRCTFGLWGEKFKGDRQLISEELGVRNVKIDHLIPEKYHETNEIRRTSAS